MILRFYLVAWICPSFQFSTITNHDAMHFLIAVSLDIGLKESIKHILMWDLLKCSPKWFYLFTLSAVVDGAFLLPHSYKQLGISRHSHFGPSDGYILTFTFLITDELNFCHNWQLKLKCEMSPICMLLNTLYPAAGAFGEGWRTFKGGKTWLYVLGHHGQVLRHCRQDLTSG